MLRGALYVARGAAGTMREAARGPSDGEGSHALGGGGVYGSLIVNL